MITLEKFKKLKQNDRIEFLLRLDRIEKKEDYSSYSIHYFLDFCYFFMLYSLLGYLALGVTFFIKLLFLFSIGIKIYLIWIVIDILLSFYFSYKQRKKINELEREFFTKNGK